MVTDGAGDTRADRRNSSEIFIERTYLKFARSTKILLLFCKVEASIVPEIYLARVPLSDKIRRERYPTIIYALYEKYSLFVYALPLAPRTSNKFYRQRNNNLLMLIAIE